MAVAQVTNNPAMTDGSSLHQYAKQQVHQYLRTYVQPLMRAGKPLDFAGILTCPCYNPLSLDSETKTYVSFCAFNTCTHN